MHTQTCRKFAARLISVSDKTGLDRARPCAGRAGRGAAEHGRHGGGAQGRGAQSQGRLRAHGLPGDDGRPREDAASQGARRPARHPRQRRARQEPHASMPSRPSICSSSISTRSRRRSPRARGYEDCVENIDIGGPAMIRAAAKNHDGVAVVVDAADYDCRARSEMKAHARRDDSTRCVSASPPRPTPARRPTTRRSAIGSPRR